MSETITVKQKKAAFAYDIAVGIALAETGKEIRRIVGPETRRVIIVSNKKVFGLYGKAVGDALRKSGFDVSVYLIGDGERFKNLRTFEKTLAAFNSAGLSRTDAVVALGGGVVGDLAGFAASVHLRGVRFIQIPTTLLSMIDSSVGGKTGVNTVFGKNLVGSFYQPAGVLIDTGTLRTLPPREMTAGLCEAVKQAAIAGGKLFAMTRKTLSGDIFTNDLAAFIAAHIRFKAKIISGDEREDPDRTDAASRKILNFGHTVAHALEKATDYRYLKHGEAVGWGIIFAAELSKKLELLPPDEVKLLNDVVHRAGTLPRLNKVDPAAIFDSFRFDKKVVNNSLNWVLLKGIGKPVITSDQNIPRKAIRETIEKVIEISRISAEE
jgi:3-dehydroquinate synthase